MKCLDEVDEALLQEIMVSADGIVDLRILMDIIDMFSLLPMTKERVKN